MDLAKRQDPDGSVSAIAELLSQDNEILEDMPYVEGNLTTGHRATIRTGLPTATWRKLNAGIPTSKSRTNQVDATCGMLEARGAVRSEEHTSELQSLMRNSYAVFCLKKKKERQQHKDYKATH